MEKKSNLKQVVKFIWDILKEYPFLGSIIIITIAIYSSQPSVIAYATKNIVDALEINNNHESLGALKFSAILYILVAIFFATTYQLGNFLEKTKLLPKLYKRITELTFAMILKQNYFYHKNNLSGNLGNKIHDLATSIPTILKLFLNGALSYCLSIIFSLYALSFVNIKYSIITTSWLFFFIITSSYTIKQMINWSKKLAESQSYIAGKIVNVFLNIFPIKLFCGIKKEKNYINSHLDKNLKIEITSQQYFIYLSIYAEVSIIIIQAINLYLLISDRAKGLVTIGDFILILSLNYSIIYLAVFGIIFEYLGSLIGLYGKISQALQVIQEEPNIKDHPSAIELSIMKGEIIFDKVCFGYQDNDNIFIDKSIKIHGGQSVGLVGFSGSGKSSFVNLILNANSGLEFNFIYFAPTR